MSQIVALLFGTSWRTSAAGLAAGLITLVVTYAQAQPQPGWYVVAAGFALLGRLVKDASVTNAPTPGPAIKAP